MMLSERLRPHRISELIGNEQSRLELVKWLKNWKLGSKAVLLMGPPGVGKSTAVHAVAMEFGYAVSEYNASDVRTREKLRSALGPGLVNESLQGVREKILVFLDEVDGISGRYDYAGSEFILEFIEGARVPVAMAANVEDDPKLRKLEQKSIVLRFKPIDEQMMLLYLKSVSKREKLAIAEETLGKIVSTSRGDVRSALNMLQLSSKEGYSYSGTDKQFFSDALAVNAFLNASTLSEASSILREFDATPYDKLRAVFDSVVSATNLSVEAKSKALDLVAEADILLSRISREQRWRLLRYFDRILASATLGKGLKRTDSSIPWNLRIAIWNNGRVVKLLQEDLAGIFHVGRSDFTNFYLPYFSQYFKKRPREFEEFASRHDLSDSEKRVLIKISK